MADKREQAVRWPVATPAFWRPTRVAGAAVFAVGLVAALVVAASGLNSGAQAKLITLAALMLVGAGAVMVPDDEGQASARAVQIILWMVAGLALANLAFAWIDLNQWTWKAPQYFPFTTPIGTDFRNGAYAAAQHFSNATTGWPPFTVVLAAPYLLFGQNGAYVVHVCVLLAMNIGSLWLALSCTRALQDDAGERTGHWNAHATNLVPAIAVWLFLSFGFLLSIERGNFDAFAAFFGMLGLWLLLRRPTWVWLPTIAFSLAAEIKVYPALLLLLLVWRFKWKSILPIVVCNVILALSAGPQNFINFFRNATEMTSVGGSWVGNSSAKSFSLWVDWLNPGYLPHLPEWLLLAIPIALFLAAAWPLLRRPDQTATVLMMTAMVPVMCLLPSISNDYKVGLLAGPAVMLAAILPRNAGARSAESWWMLLALAVSLFFIARAPGDLLDYTANVRQFIWPAILMNKYPAILLFQIVTVWMAWRLPMPAEERQADTAQAGVPLSGIEETI